MSGFGQKPEHSAAVQGDLLLLAPPETFLAPNAESALELGDELKRFGGKNLSEGRRYLAYDLDAARKGEWR